ncbi:MAG: efflux RND transporter permease subunit [Planctomycetes bacterium]|nr:efflux RND transporter permease subunit [Planctomycetota bacterium]
MLEKLSNAFLERRLAVWLLMLMLVGWGVLVAPFDWKIGDLPRNPVPVDAIPDIGENQQIVFTEWMGRSPQDVEDQVTYPLTVSLLGVPGVKTIRSYSYFGFSTVYVIFEDDIEFYWSRSRVLEKLNSLPAGTLPDGIQPALGPDATALGQVFWYTLEGRDAAGNPTGGWDLDELRSSQDWLVRYALMSAAGIAEVASVGGYLREYQVDVDPEAMRAHRVTLQQIFQAVREANLEVGARVIELNAVEYFVRGLGWVESLSDLEQAVVRSEDGVAIRIVDVATVSAGPAQRRGALDKGGAEVVGGVAVVRYGSNPLAAIKALKAKIKEIAPGLPKKTLADGTVSQLTIVPFYDRTGLIYETLDTLNEAISQEILVTIMVVLLLLMRMRPALLVSATLPLVVLFCFILMKVAGVDANLVALSGIAIAIGTIVDVGIVMIENIQERMDEGGVGVNRVEAVKAGVAEVGPAVLTAITTTILGFLPVFTMTGAEGKLFQPLAWTKTFALLGSAVVAILFLPVLAATFLRPRVKILSKQRYGALVNLLLYALVGWLLSRAWHPLGIEFPGRNLVFCLAIVTSLLLFFRLFERAYPWILGLCLAHKKKFLLLPSAIILFGFSSWLGFQTVFGWIPAGLNLVGLPGERLEKTEIWTDARHALPGFGREFMPPLDEGSFLFMPTTAPHASIGTTMEILRQMDMAIQAIPEVEMAVGKLGRVESALDPAPVSMVETIIELKPEYIFDENGDPVRVWREEIKTAQDVWEEIVRVAKLPGVTSAPKLQPIAARLVMLQSGMRAPMGLKIKGPDLATIEAVALQVESMLKEVPVVEPATVIADRVIGKPYLEFEIDRKEAARYGLNVMDVHQILEVGLGGKKITTTIEGRERYPVRVRYQRERRDSLEEMERLLLPTPSGAQIPLSQVAKINYSRGPQAIKTEDTFLVAYVTFGSKPGLAEVDVIEQCRDYLSGKLESGEWQLPTGVSYYFAGAWENQVRASKTLAVVLPVALLLILLVLYLQFNSIMTTCFVFSGVFVAWSGGFLLLWLYSTAGFLDFEVLSTNMRDLFQVSPRNLSVAVWVGFLALFGIATDDGVVIATYLKQNLERRKPKSISEVRKTVIEAGKRRCRPCLMTTATTTLALLPVMSSTGRGADVMVPMAIPSLGGMIVALITMFVVPVLTSIHEEYKIRKIDASKAKSVKPKPLLATHPDTPQKDS